MTATAPASSAILRLLGRDDVHDHAALEHLGHAALDAVGAGAGGRGAAGGLVRCHGYAASNAGRRMKRKPHRTAGQRPRIPGTVGAAGQAAERGRRCRSTAAAAATRAAAAAAAAGAGAAPRVSRDRVVVEPAAPARRGSRCRQVGPERGPATPGELGGQLPQLPAQHVLRHLAVPVHRRPGVRRERGEVAAPAPPPRLPGSLAGQFLGQPGPPLQLRVQRRPGAVDAGLEPAQPPQGPAGPGSRTQERPGGQSATRPRASRRGQASAGPDRSSGRPRRQPVARRRQSSSSSPPCTTPPPSAATTVS